MADLSSVNSMSLSIVLLDYLNLTTNYEGIWEKSSLIVQNLSIEERPFVLAEMEIIITFQKDETPHNFG